ncbi:transporter [Burkholderia anthina]|uniref:Transporter n=1 Tax=Burkholderia anthina TaxID=179879 RepID=A0A6P2G2N7_9BURK|nr:transporter [Burkholderia anthina]
MCAPPMTYRPADTLTGTPSAVGGNTYSSGTTITKGTLSVAVDNAFGISSGNLNFDGGTPRLGSEHQCTITGNESVR